GAAGRAALSSGQVVDELRLEGGQIPRVDAAHRFVETLAVAERREQLAQGAAAGVLQQGADREVALGIGDVDAVAGQAREGALESAEREQDLTGERLVCPVLAIAVRLLLAPDRDALVEPHRRAVAAQLIHQNVPVFVAQRALEHRAIAVLDAARRQLDAPVVDAARPTRRLRDVVEVFARIEHHRYAVAGVEVELATDVEVGILESARDRLRRRVTLARAARA